MILLENLKIIRTAHLALVEELRKYPEEAAVLGWPNPDKYWDKWRINTYQPAKELVDYQTAAEAEIAQLQAAIDEAQRRLDAATKTEDVEYYQSVINLLKK